MRETRNAQASIFEHYSNHEYGVRLRKLSDVLDRQPEVLDLVAADLIDAAVSAVGRTGLSVESVLRCLVLRQQLGFSYEQLAFHLSDSVTYRTFARLPAHLSPSRSCLQSTIRRIRPETLAQAHQAVTRHLISQGVISLDKLRIDSTVVASHIAPPSDSQLLNDGVRVILAQLVFFVLLDDFLYYWMHRYMHENKWLLRNVHSVHHRIRNTCG